MAPPAALANAVEDALRHFGVRIDATPITPSRLRALLSMPDRRVQLLVRNGTIVTSSGRYNADLAAADGRLSAIAAPGGLDDCVAEETIDATDRFVLPGVIDDHVHFREPGLEYKEDWGSGSRVGRHGRRDDGPRDAEHAAADQHGRAGRGEAAARRGEELLRLWPVRPRRPGQRRRDLQPWPRRALPASSAFSGRPIGSIPSPDDGVLLEAMQRVGEADLRIGFHAENNAILQHCIRQLKRHGGPIRWPTSSRGQRLPRSRRFSASPCFRS